MSLGPHCPSFHTNSGGGIDVGKVARAMSATQAEDTHWPGPTGAGSRVLWLQHDPFPAPPVQVRATRALALGAVIHFVTGPK